MNGPRKRGYPGAGNPMFGGPAREFPPATRAGDNPSFLPDIQYKLYRGAPFRLWVRYEPVAVTPPILKVPFYSERMLVSAMYVFADTRNSSRICIGNREVTSAVTDPAGVAGNNYVQLDAGRGAYVWTDDPETEYLDMAQWWAAQEIAGSDQFLHITPWAASALGGNRGI